MAERKNLHLQDLELDETNYRIGKHTSQREALQSLIDEQGSKLPRLAEDILDNNLSPIELLMVAPNGGDPERYVVIEGNRRIAAMKLILQPDLAAETSVHNAFKKLNKRSGELPDEIECVVVPNKEAGFMWIRRRHDTGLRGIGTEEWSAIAKVRAAADQGRSAPAHDVLEFVLAHGVLDDDLREAITGHNFPVSNLDRLLDSPSFRDELNLVGGNTHLKSTADQKWLLAVFTDVVTAIAREEYEGNRFTVRNIYSAEQQKAFAKSIAAKHPKPKKPTPVWSLDATVDLTASSATTGAKATKKKAPRTVERRRLVPRHCSISPPPGRANDIYLELRQLDVDKFRNSAAILLRVFLEFSVEDYMKRHKITSVLPSDELKKKLAAVVAHLRTNGTMSNKELMPISKAIADPNSLISIATLNAYVHHPTFYPSPDELKTSWDRLEPFLLNLWHA